MHKSFCQMQKMQKCQCELLFVFTDPSGIQSPLIANDTFILATGCIWGQNRVQFGRESISSCQSTWVYGQLKQFRLNKISNKVHPMKAKQCDLFSCWPWFTKTMLSTVLPHCAAKSYIFNFKLWCGKNQSNWALWKTPEAFLKTILIWNEPRTSRLVKLTLLNF